MPHTLARLTVQHAGVAPTDDRLAPARVRGYQRDHHARGWPDLAYHWVVDRRGNVYEGRAVTARGDTGTSYDPTGHFLVMADGDFDRQPVADAQLDAVADMLAWGVRRFGLSLETLAGHRDYAATACPGASLAARLADGTLRRRVEARLAAGGVEAVIVCGPEPEARVGAIEAGGS